MACQWRETAHLQNRISCIISFSPSKKGNQKRTRFRTSRTGPISQECELGAFERVTRQKYTKQMWENVGKCQKVHQTYHKSSQLLYRLSYLVHIVHESLES